MRDQRFLETTRDQGDEEERKMFLILMEIIIRIRVMMSMIEN